MVGYDKYDKYSGYLLIFMDLYIGYLLIFMNCILDIFYIYGFYMNIYYRLYYYGYLFFCGPQKKTARSP